MCGILGVINYECQRPVDRTTAFAMAMALHHRGPDDDGYYFHGRAALGMRRLSIIDPAGGHQPISNEHNSLWVVCNGEIYNFRELRADLVARGHRFRTQSDAEVIVHLYEEHGDDLVVHLNGMFAFALWDERGERLLMARARMGEKPLYFGVFTNASGRAFVFASELKALLAHPAVEHRLNLHALRKYLSYEFVPSPHTMLDGIRKLRPGHRLSFAHNQWQETRYW